MSIPAPRPPHATDDSADQRLIMFNVPWTGFDAQLSLRGDASVPRVAYLDGAMELMSPSLDHERVKSNIGRLIETYALERGIDLQPYGGWTLKSAPKAAGNSRWKLNRRLGCLSERLGPHVRRPAARPT